MAAKLKSAVEATRTTDVLVILCVAVNLLHILNLTRLKAEINCDGVGTTLLSPLVILIVGSLCAIGDLPAGF